MRKVSLFLGMFVFIVSISSGPSFAQFKLDLDLGKAIKAIGDATKDPKEKETSATKDVPKTGVIKKNAAPANKPPVLKENELRVANSSPKGILFCGHAGGKNCYVYCSERNIGGWEGWDDTRGWCKAGNMRGDKFDLNGRPVFRVIAGVIAGVGLNGRPVFRSTGELTKDLTRFKRGMICQKKKNGNDWYFDCGDNRDVESFARVEIEKKNALEKKRAAKRAEEARLAKERKLEIERKKQAAAREKRAREQAMRTETEEWVVAYNSRKKTTMETVYNFANYNDMDGALPILDTGWEKNSKLNGAWVEAPECVMTHYQFSSIGALVPKTQINSRQINETALRMEYPHFPDDSMVAVMRSTDYKTLEIHGPSDIAQDRLQKAWGLALGECPGKKSEF